MLTRTEGSVRLALLVVLLGAAGGVYLYHARSKTEPRGATPVRSTVAPSAEMAARPSVRHPLPGPGGRGPLPSLEQSDGVVLTVLRGLFGEDAVARFLVTDALIERFVATVDSLPEGKLPLDIRPVVPIDGRTYATPQKGDTQSYTLSETNYDRYEPFMHALRVVATQRLVDAYAEYYPLLQEAYEGLGYPDRYFNDRVVAVIDHLLQTPEVSGTIELLRPSVYYEFADPALEDLSAGQKVLLRMGPANAAVVKEKLREIRAQLATRPSGTGRIAERAITGGEEEGSAVPVTIPRLGE